MLWTKKDDATPAVISAEGHARSAHGGQCPRLPETAVLFAMGGALQQIEQSRPAITLAQELPCFIARSRCIALQDRPDVCFVKSGLGAPAAVDTLETMRALGVKRVIVAGMCGGFSPELTVGAVVVPRKVLCREGTSFHYYARPRWARPDKALHRAAQAYFSRGGDVCTEPTVSCDAVYRQTMAKEAAWREEGCVAVDMEASALLNAARFYGMPAAALLLCSDMHPLREGEAQWAWGSEDFAQKRQAFVQDCVRFVRSL